MTDCLLLAGFRALLTLGGLGGTHHGAGTDLCHSAPGVSVGWLPLLHPSDQHDSIDHVQAVVCNNDCCSLGFLKDVERGSKV